MTHDDGRPDEGTVEALLAKLGAPRPAFTGDELVAGFSRVLDGLAEAEIDETQASLFDNLVAEAEIGRDAYALGMEFLEQSVWDKAAHWLRTAAHHGIADAEYELHALQHHRLLALTGPTQDADDRELEAGAARLARLRRAFARLHSGATLAHTLKAVADGLVYDLDYRASCLNLVRPDGALVVAAVTGNETAEAFLVGRAGPRAAWENRRSMGERWGNVVYVSHQIGWTADGDGVPCWRSEGLDWAPGRWHAEDRLFAEMHTTDGTLLGVLSVDHPRNGLLPGPWDREALQTYAVQSALAITNARLRANAQRTQVRLERKHVPLHGGEDQIRETLARTQQPMALAALPPGRPSRLIKANDALCQLLGRSPNALLELSIEDLVHPDDLHSWLRLPLSANDCEVRIAHRDGTYLHAAISAAPIAGSTTPSDDPCCLITLERTKPGQTHGRHRFHRDALTGALSGDALRDELHRRCDTAAGQSDTTSLAVLFVGLDDFTQVNTDHGQAAGDTVLMEVVQRLTSMARASDLVARLGGDEFALMVVGRTHQQIEELAPRVQASIARPIRLGTGTLRLRASIGYTWAKHGMTAEQVLNTADQDMYFDKTLRKTACLSQAS